MKIREPTAEARQQPDRDRREISRRLAEKRRQLEQGVQPDIMETRRILEQRAAMLARRPPRKDTATIIEVVEFAISRERYGVESLHVREVYPLKDLTPLPCTPLFVAGIINCRGRIVSVIDLKKLFDLPAKGLSNFARVIILGNDDMEFGLLADGITGVRRIPLPDLQTSLPTLTEIRAEYLKGVTGDRLVVLDGQKILSDRKLVVNEEVGG